MYFHCSSDPGASLFYYHTAQKCKPHSSLLYSAHQHCIMTSLRFCDSVFPDESKLITQFLSNLYNYFSAHTVLLCPYIYHLSRQIVVHYVWRGHVNWDWAISPISKLIWLLRYGNHQLTIHTCSMLEHLYTNDPVWCRIVCFYMTSSIYCSYMTFYHVISLPWKQSCMRAGWFSFAFVVKLCITLTQLNFFCVVLIPNSICNICVYTLAREYNIFMYQVIWLVILHAVCFATL